MERIDNLDRKILEIVMRNARIPSKDVATECGVSRAAIHQRIQRMIDLKVITGSGYHVNPKVLGYRTCTYIGVNLERGAMYRDVVPELEKSRGSRMSLHYRPLHHADKAICSRQRASYGAA